MNFKIVAQIDCNEGIRRLSVRHGLEVSDLHIVKFKAPHRD